MNQMAKDTVEDALEMNFSTAELQRYSRQINLSQVGKEGQTTVAAFLPWRGS